MEVRSGWPSGGDVDACCMCWCIVCSLIERLLLNFLISP